ncbi:MAG TPA: SET domain-containing protein-lysine N-methyltransferase [Patescibacteria group bacterium]|nr:SET domain-containing protein-lysine N-methyltransferase [Patescibacteria group bacterium]
MNSSPYTLNLSKLGVEVNKDVSRDGVFSLYTVHRAGSTHGTGIFAKRDIFQDEEIIRTVGPEVGENIADALYSSYGIDVLVQVGIKKWVLPTNETRFINHSCEPNMGFRTAGVFVAMKDIKVREELTYDYAMCEINDSSYNWIINCLCKTKSCRKKISNLDIFEKNLGLAEKYKGYLPNFVLKEIARRGLF